MRTIQIGEKFGRLTVLRETTKEERKNKEGRNYWCKCDCGNEVIVYGHNLKTGNTKSCGCLNSELASQRNSIDIPIGSKFGHLTVVERAPIQEGINLAFWRCKCSCGKEVEVRGTDLRSGNTKTCGDAIHRIQNEIGNRYGNLTVLEYAGSFSKTAYWKCQCDCGNIIITRGSSLRNGHTKSCGCIKSFKEQEIIELLKQYNIKYDYQYSFKDLITSKGGYPRFDFAIFKEDNLYCLIEYQGEQHIDSDNIWYSEDYIARDNLKREYCQKHNIPLYYCNKDTDLNNFISSLMESD